MNNSYQLKQQCTFEYTDLFLNNKLNTKWHISTWDLLRCAVFITNFTVQRPKIHFHKFLYSDCWPVVVNFTGPPPF